jgi:hypothetical protein
MDVIVVPKMAVGALNEVPAPTPYEDSPVHTGHREAHALSLDWNRCRTGAKSLSSLKQRSLVIVTPGKHP